jgi:hypothetical protein
MRRRGVGVGVGRFCSLARHVYSGQMLEMFRWGKVAAAVGGSCLCVGAWAIVIACAARRDSVCINIHSRPTHFTRLHLRIIGGYQVDEY